MAKTVYVVYLEWDCEGSAEPIAVFSDRQRAVDHIYDFVPHAGYGSTCVKELVLDVWPEQKL